MATTYTDTKISQLVINKLTNEEFAGITPDPNQLYLLPEPYPLPTGVILPYGGASAPAGFFLCDGSPVSRTDYAGLFALIGTAFGTGDGSTTFNLPDMREVVPVGAGTNTRAEINTHDSYNIGEFKDDQLQEHQHKFGASDATEINVGVMSDQGSNGSNVFNGYITPWSSLGVRGVYGARQGSTTHGKQLGVNYIIKY